MSVGHRPRGVKYSPASDGEVNFSEPVAVSQNEAQRIHSLMQSEVWADPPFSQEVSGRNGIVHGDLRDFCKRCDRRVVDPPSHRHQFENLGTPLVFSRFNAVRTLTYDGARALLLR